MEVTFEEARRHLGLETQRQWSDRAIACTTPVLLGLFSLVTLLAAVADRLVGGPDAGLIIDDTALPTRGTHSVGVARQYCGALGQRAHCPALVSLTLARGAVPVPLARRLDLPEPLGE